MPSVRGPDIGTMAHEKKISELHPEVQAEIKSLAPRIGLVKLPKQIMNAVEYLDFLGHTQASFNREDAFDALVYPDHARMDSNRVWSEISFCRMIGEPSQDVVRIPPNDPRFFSEVLTLAQHWVLMTGNGALGGLQEWPDIEAAKKRGEGVAGQLRAYLDARQRAAGFDQWTYEHMNDARLQVVKVGYRFHGVKVEPLVATGNEAIPKGRSSMAAQLGEPEAENLGMDAVNNTHHDLPSTKVYPDLDILKHRDASSAYSQRSRPAVETYNLKKLSGTAVHTPRKFCTTSDGSQMGPADLPLPQKRKRASASNFPDLSGASDPTASMIDPKRTKHQTGGFLGLSERRDALNVPGNTFNPAGGVVEVSKAAAHTALLSRLHLSDTAKANALVVRRSHDGIFDQLHSVLRKWEEGHSVELSTMQDVYVADIYALQRLATEQQKAMASIEAADRGEAEAEKALEKAIAEVQNAEGGAMGG